MIGCLFCLQVDGPILSCGGANKWGLGLIIGCIFCLLVDGPISWGELTSGGRGLQSDVFFCLQVDGPI